MFLTIPELKESISKYTELIVESQSIIEAIENFKNKNTNVWIKISPNNGIDYCYPYKIDGVSFCTYMVEEQFGIQMIMPNIKQCRLYPTREGYKIIKSTEELLVNTFGLEPYSDLRLPGEQRKEDNTEEKKDDLTSYIINRNAKLIREGKIETDDKTLLMLLTDKENNFDIQSIQLSSIPINNNIK